MINYRLIAYILGWILTLFGVSFLLPMIPAAIFMDGSLHWFWLSSLLIISVGLLFIFLGKAYRQQEARFRDSLAVVGLSWFLISLFGAFPYWLSGFFDFWSGLFESFSGFSSTGATNISDLSLIPKGLLFWRAFSQWLGGMGIIVLMVAVLPFLGVGGQLLFKHEVSGPATDKLRPRVAETAKILWMVYLGLTTILLGLLSLGGLDFFEALCQTFATISTGGFSLHNQSMLHQSLYLKLVTIVFMLLGSMSFALFYQALCGHWRSLVLNTELLFLLGVIVTVSVFVFFSFPEEDMAKGPGSLLVMAIFQVVSIVSTTGLVTCDWTLWPYFAQGLLFFLFFVGGCSGSTSGGFKCIRWILLLKVIHRAFRRHIHPRGVFPVRFDGRIVADSVLEGVFLFLGLYVLVLALASLFLTFMGLDLITSFSAVASALGNVGPALGQISVGSYADLPGAVKGVLSLCMLLGRLEFFSFLVLFFPEFWSK